MNILITGATGFVGQYLCANQQWGQSQTTFDSDPKLRLAVRQVPNKYPASNTILIENIGPDTNWSEALDSIDIVIHLAGLAHQVDSSDSKNHQQFNQVNSEGTRNLAIQAAKYNVKRFIYMSSIKVYGENILNHTTLTETSETGRGCDAYGLSKLEAEKHLIKIAADSKMEFVIIRSPLVYGPGVGANFKALMKLAETAIPLPFASIDNKRSMVAIDNLVDFIQCCLTNENAANQIFLIKDGDDLSLPRLITLIRKAFKSPVRLFRLPLILLKLITRLLGRAGQLKKLTNSAQLNTEKVHKLLNWKPVINAEDAITKTVKDYQESK